METKLFIDLMKWFDKQNYKAYEKIDTSIAGEKECDAIYLSETISGREKEELANGLLEVLIESLKYEGKDEGVAKFINRFPIVDYYFTFIDKVKILLKEKVISKEELFIAGSRYTKECNDSECIKLGLSLLRFADCTEALYILKVYSNHNEFIFYSIEGIKEYDMCNSIVFSIAKGSKGYGKIIALSNLEPLNDDIRIWIIEDGSKNDILENALLILKFNEYDYLNYFSIGRKTKKKYEIFTRNLKLLCDMDEILSDYITFDIIDLYFEYYKKFDKSFENLYVIYNMLAVLYEDVDNKVLNELSDEEKSIRDEMVNEVFSYNYEEVIKDEISFGEHNKKSVIDIASAFEINLNFDDLKEALKYEPFNADIYEYILKKVDVNDKKSLINFACKNINFNKISNKKEYIYDEDINKEYLDYEYFQDLALYLIVSSIKDDIKDYVDVNIKALKARYVSTRRVAFNNFKSIGREISENIIEEIKVAHSLERDKDLKISMARFLDTRNDMGKEQRFVDIADVKVKSHTKDILLLKTNVVGTQYRDLTIVEDELVNGTTVFLKREEDNIYDKNAIMVLNKDGYLLGYISKEQNKILKNLLEYEKIIYGKITNVSEDYLNIELELFLSYVDVIEEVSATLNMMTDDVTGYLN